MSETLVERMAGAIRAACFKATKSSEETPWEEIALAALRAIKEPSEAVADAIQFLHNPFDAWTAGIDAAIAEAEPNGNPCPKCGAGPFLACSKPGCPQVAS